MCCISNLFVRSLFEAKADEQNAACFSLPAAITGHRALEPDIGQRWSLRVSNKTVSVHRLVSDTSGLDSVEKIYIQQTLVLGFNLAVMLALELVLYAVISAFGKRNPACHSV